MPEISTVKSTDPGTVIHILPSDEARGAQVYARLLCDQLNRTPSHPFRHEILTIFDGPPGKAQPDHELAVGAGRRVLSPVAAIRLRRRLNVLSPVVVVAHGSNAQKYLRLSGSDRPSVLLRIGTNSASLDRSRIRRVVYRWLQATPCAVVGVSKEALSAAEIIGLPPTTHRCVIANGRDPDIFFPDPNGRTGPVHIAFVGHLFEGKRPDVFAEIVRRLRPHHEFVASIAGDGPEAVALAGPAADLRIDLVGRLGDVASFLRRVDVLVFPSEPENEGMPGILIEAGMSAVPTVAARVPGVDTIVANEETGIVTPTNDPAEMAGAVARLLDSVALRARYGSAARERCTARFSLETTLAQWDQVLLAAAGRRRELELGDLPADGTLTRGGLDS